MPDNSKRITEPQLVIDRRLPLCVKCKRAYALDHQSGLCHYCKK